MTGGADGVGDEMMEVGDGDAVGVGADDGGAHTGSAADVDRGEAEAAPVEAAPDARRLQARVVNPATKEVLADRFVAGKNQLRVRIAAKGAEGAATADVAFASPTPGRAADLTVEIIAGDTHSSQELELPAIADSKWTRAVAVRGPRRDRHLPGVHPGPLPGPGRPERHPFRSRPGRGCAGAAPRACG